MSEQDQTQDSSAPTPAWKKISAVVGIMVPLLGFFGAGAYKLVEFGKVQATVEQQNLLLAEYKEKNHKLDEQNEKLTSTIRSLEQEIASVRAKLGNAEEHVTVTTNQLNQYKSEAMGLAQKLAKNNPCIVIQNTIADLEEALARDDYFRLKGDRRAEAQAQVEQHQESLRACLGKAS
ncbi:hypothetical protein [Pseudomonas chlororaphis]|uniref:hypothetical protein n=1 Tax=Pseudomonas chlororaphis TaxID=587753 RepID=UPI002D79246E|nr:hypothetical protein [Pseudomonas chlororaphis]